MNYDPQSTMTVTEEGMDEEQRDERLVARCNRIATTKLAADATMQDAVSTESGDRVGFERAVAAYAEVRQLLVELAEDTPISQFTHDLELSCCLNTSCDFLK